VKSRNLREPSNKIYSDCKKNVPLAEGFLLQALMPPSFYLERIYDKRYKALKAGFAFLIFNGLNPSAAVEQDGFKGKENL
jgi:hypothetical protein